MKDNDKILAQDLIKISEVSTLLTGDRFKLRLDRSFGKHEASVNRLFSAVQDWIDSDKSFGAELTTPAKEFVADLPREFEAKSVVIKPKTEIPTTVVKADYEDKKEIEYLESLPFSQMINVIGQKLHKHHTESIYYIKNPEKIGANIAVLYSEKEVKDFIRKEIVK